MLHSQSADREESPSQVVRLTTCQWSSELASPAVDEIRVCCVPLEHPPLPITDLFGCLAADERNRAERYLVVKPRHQFIATRGILRLLLGNILGIAPEKVPIGYTGVGKPILLGISSALHFNVTHTDGLGLIALASHVIGVDVEKIRPIANPEGLIARFFSPAEQATYLLLDPLKRRAGFFRGWTCKEALIKAAGLSVAYLDEFDVELNPDEPAKLLAARHPGLAGTEWGLAAWIPAEGYSAAVAVEGVREVATELAEPREDRRGSVAGNR